MSKVILEEWEAYAPGFELPEAVQAVTEEMNRFSEAATIERMPLDEHRRDEASGMRYALLGGKAASVEECVVIFSSFANKTSPHNLIKADFIRRSLKEAGIRDTNGDELGVMVLASPSRGSGLKSREDEKKAHTQDAFRTLGRSGLDTVRRRGFSKVSLTGHSQGGTAALSAASSAEAMGMDVAVTAASNVLGSKEQTMRQLQSGFMANGPLMRAEVTSAGLRPYTEAFGYDRPKGKVASRLPFGPRDVMFATDMLSHPVRNFQLFKNMTDKRFMRDLFMAAEINHAPLVIGHGNADDIVSPTADVLDMMRDVALRQRDTRMALIEVMDGKHTWSDHVPLWGAFILRASELAS